LRIILYLKAGLSPPAFSQNDALLQIDLFSLE